MNTLLIVEDEKIVRQGIYLKACGMRTDCKDYEEVGEGKCILCNDAGTDTEGDTYDIETQKQEQCICISKNLCLSMPLIRFFLSSIRRRSRSGICR